MKNHLKILLLSLTITLSLTGCLAAAAGVGAEAAYVTTQDDRTVGETMHDQAITASLKTKLFADQQVSGFDINIDTFKSVVTLRGMVRSQQQIDRAVELAHDTSGVKKVQSKLVIG